nr:odorant receptor 5 [Psyttalia incisi]
MSDEGLYAIIPNLDTNYEFLSDGFRSGSSILRMNLVSSISAWEQTIRWICWRILREGHWCTLLQSNAMELQDWTFGTHYELMVYKLIMWPLGIWPLNKGEIFSEIRLLLAASTQVYL